MSGHFCLWHEDFFIKSLKNITQNNYQRSTDFLLSKNSLSNGVRESSSSFSMFAPKSIKSCTSGSYEKKPTFTDQCQNMGKNQVKHADHCANFRFCQNFPQKEKFDFETCHKISKSAKILLDTATISNF